MIIHYEITGYDKKLEIRIVSYNGRVEHTNIHIRIERDVPHEPLVISNIILVGPFVMGRKKMAGYRPDEALG